MYHELLKDPRWQRKRLDILNRDGFTCQSCFDNSKELHVHHLKYGEHPWSVDDIFLITLCKDCHKNTEKVKVEINNLLAEVLMKCGAEIYFLIPDLLQSIIALNPNPFEFNNIINIKVNA